MARRNLGVFERSFFQYSENHCSMITCHIAVWSYIVIMNINHIHKHTQTRAPHNVRLPSWEMSGLCGNNWRVCTGYEEIRNGEGVNVEVLLGGDGSRITTWWHLYGSKAKEEWPCLDTRVREELVLPNLKWRSWVEINVSSWSNKVFGPSYNLPTSHRNEAVNLHL